MRRILVVLFIVTSLACETENTTAPPDNGPFTGKAYLRGQVGSINFFCNDSASQSTEIDPKATIIQNTNGTYHIAVDGIYFANQQQLSLTIVGEISNKSDSSYAIGKVVIDPRMNLVAGYNIGGPTSGTYIPDVENAGTFTVIVFDTTRKRIKGTFEAVLLKAGGVDTLSISNGSYEISY